jgi:hypothetical protein
MAPCGHLHRERISISPLQHSQEIGDIIRLLLHFLIPVALESFLHDPFQPWHTSVARLFSRTTSLVRHSPQRCLLVRGLLRLAMLDWHKQTKMRSGFLTSPATKVMTSHLSLHAMLPSNLRPEKACAMQPHHITEDARIDA